MNKKLKVIPLNTNFNKKWQFEFIKESIYSLNKFSNVEVVEVGFKKFGDQKNIIPLQLIELQKYIQEIEDCYICLIDYDLAPIRSFDTIDLNNDLYVSEFAFNRFHIKSQHYIANKLEFSTKKILFEKFYKQYVNTNYQSELKIYELPVFINKNVLKEIIERWAELTLTFFNSGDSKTNPIFQRFFGYKFGFSCAINEKGLKPELMNIVHFNQLLNDYSIFYDMNDDLKINTIMGSKTVYTRPEDLGSEIYEDKNLNKEQKLFIDNLNNFIIKNQIKAEIPSIMPI